MYWQFNKVVQSLPAACLLWADESITESLSDFWCLILYYVLGLCVYCLRGDCCVYYFAVFSKVFKTRESKGWNFEFLEFISVTCIWGWVAAPAVRPATLDPQPWVRLTPEYPFKLSAVANTLQNQLSTSFFKFHCTSWIKEQAGTLVRWTALHIVHQWNRKVPLKWHFS